ncbi:hypothetical protein SBOR_9152 [Sclerotinia borealis F-4128]|uniref:Deacetylase-like protein n=1 Tax=Sclerotinia borealis (strain F-4128) TaxID=1432307 RepID=W9C428_SCLBF|nr:hypothetical protein SBOR_9152 [Sclerotinia borealis F-4128]
MPSKEPKLKLKQPDRSGPDPSVETLLDIAQIRNLSEAQRKRQAELDEENKEILVGRLGESFLWTISLTMLHFTFDVLVTHQYAEGIVWRNVIYRTLQASPGKLYKVFGSLRTFADSDSPLASLLCLSSTPRTFAPTSTTAYQGATLHTRHLLFRS